MAARILIIEDNPASLDLIRYLLQAYGYTPLTACDGEEGLETARRERPDLILCDVQLPKKSGYEVALQVKDHPTLRKTPLVAVTALAMVGDRDRVLAAGFDGYITKPIAPESFIGQVENYLPPDRHAKPGPPPAPAESVAAPPPAGHRRILVVDDDPVNLALNRSIFEPLDYAVATASGMSEALATARRTPPDLIISDVNMFEGSGFDLIRSVKADPRLSSIPFVFITSTAQNEKSRAEGLSLGAARFLFRPLEPQALVAEVEACLRGRTES